MVSIYKFQVYKTMSRPKVDKSSEQDFIKMILTKDEERSKRDKEWMGIRKSRCVKLDETHCCTEKFNIPLSLYEVLIVALYFSKSFSEAFTGESAVAEAL